MGLATPPLIQTRIAAIASRKRFVETRAFDASVLFNIRFNPDWEESTTVVKATAATVEVDATDIILETNALTDRSVTFTGKSMGTVIDEINAAQADGTSRWRAGLADVGPTVVDVPAVTSATAAMLGYEDGLGIGDEVILAVYLAVGTDGGDRGAGYFLPDGFNTRYDYPLDPANNPGQVGRSGGIDASQGEDFLPQRRSAFRQSPQALAQEINPSATRFITTVDSILADGLVSGIATIATYSISEIDGTVKWETDVAIATQSIEVPNVACRGPAFLTVVGDTGVAFTAGTVTMQGDRRVA